MLEKKKVEFKAPSPVGSGQVPGGQKGRGGWNAVPGWKVPKPRTPETKVSGGTAELAEVVFDCEDGKQASSFDDMLDRLATYLGCKFEHGGDLLLMIRNLRETKLEKPKPAT